MKRWSLRTTGGVAAALAMAWTPALAGGPASAEPVRTVEVIELAGGEFTDGCVGTLRYLSGEVRIREQIGWNAAGGRVVQYFVHTVGARAVSLETGVVYRDQTHDHISNQGNGTYYESEHQDGSHGVRIVSRIRLFAPGTDAPRLVLKLDMHLRRVAGSGPTPPLDIERTTYSCE